VHQPPNQGPPQQAPGPARWGPGSSSEPPRPPQWGPGPPAGRPRRPISRQLWFIVLAVPGVCGLLVVGCAGVTVTAVSTTETTESTPTRSPAISAAPTTGSSTTMPSASAAQTLTGSATTVTKAFTVTDGLAVFRLRHRGEGSFIVDLLTGRGRTVDNFTDHVGGFDGVTGQGLRAGRYRFRIEADGPWAITIEQPRPVSGKRLPPTLSGRGFDLAGPFQGRGDDVRFRLQHRGESNFVIDILDADGQEIHELTNVIGSFRGSTVGAVPEGVFWINVQADGRWAIKMQRL
jgi:hypothetical protein